MPIITKSSYTAPLFCTNRHLQTILPSLVRKVPSVSYTRERIDTPDADFLDLDLSKVGSGRLAVVLHGLEGHSRRSYVKGMVKTFNDRGWDALAVNLRGCSGEPNRRPAMYHSGKTDDLETVISYIEKSRTYDHAALIGFSLGGNIILKYLGERGDAIPKFLKGAVTISVPCDLKGSSAQIERFENRMYQTRFLKMLHEKVRAKTVIMPEIINDAGYEEIKTLKEFDERYTSRLHGFKDANDYYEKASSLQDLKNIAVPTLLINAADDPFLAESCFPREEAAASDRLFLEIPRHGGHVGFITFSDNGEYWPEKRAAAFLEDVLSGTIRNS